MKQKLIVAILLFIRIGSVGIASAQLTSATRHQILSVSMGKPGCAISVIDYYNGHLESKMNMTAGYWVDTPPVHSTLGNFGIRFACQIGHQFDDAAQTYGAQWDGDRQIWKLYDEDANDRKLLPPVSQIYQVKSPNAVGFLRTTDQINGEEGQRVRFYSFCLFHGNAAVCGSGQSMRLDEPEGDYLPFIMRILRSVSFIDDKNDRTTQ